MKIAQAIEDMPEKIIILPEDMLPLAFTGDNAKLQISQLITATTPRGGIYPPILNIGTGSQITTATVITRSRFASERTGVIPDLMNISVAGITGILPYSVTFTLAEVGTIPAGTHTLTIYDIGEDEIFEDVDGGMATITGIIVT